MPISPEWRTSRRRPIGCRPSKIHSVNLPNTASTLERIRARQARVGVIGLGYVGLPLVVEFARAGFDVTGFDVDASKTEQINAGHSYIPDVAERRSRGMRPCRQDPGDNRHEPARRDGRDRHLRPDAAAQDQGSRPLLRRPRGRSGRGDAEARAAGDSRIDDVSGDDRRGRAADARREGAEGRRRLLPRVLA